MMKRLLITLAMLLMAMPAMSQVWLIYSENDVGDLYTDPTTLKTNGNMRRVWEMLDLKTRRPDGAMSQTFLKEYDCKEESSKLLQVLTYSQPMGNGRVIYSVNPSSPSNYIRPGSNGATALDLVCANR